MATLRTLILMVLLQSIAMLTSFQEGIGQTLPVLNGDFEKLFITSSVPGWLEGPAFDGAEGIWFSDLTIPIVAPVGPQWVFRYDLMTGTVEEKLQNTGGANGLAFNAEGYLIAAHG